MDPVVSKYRKFAIAGNIFAIISLFIGGTLLSMIGFIMSHTAYRKLKPLLDQKPEDPAILSSRRLAKNAFLFCAATAVLNFVTAMTLMPAIMDQMGFGAATTAATGGIF